MVYPSLRRRFRGGAGAVDAHFAPLLLFLVSFPLAAPTHQLCHFRAVRKIVFGTLDDQ
jgi:hypothetical protein